MSVAKLEAELLEQISTTLVGLEATIRLITVALVARGHVLLEGYPGMGKTLLARSLAKTLGYQFGRVQCTADLMPSDMTGLNIYNEASASFELIKGPLFSEIVLVDEINRTGPKTQSAMLEAMEERSISIDRTSYELSERFFVIATQNPHEFEGTYPLPESQIDRFLLKIGMTYLPQDKEIEVMKAYDKPSQRYQTTMEKIKVIDDSLINAARLEADGIEVSEPIYEYVARLSEATRHHPEIALGVSTRGALALMKCARVVAALDGRTFITPDHIKTIAKPVLAHRIVLSQDALFEGVDSNRVVQDLLDLVEIPRE